MTVLNSFAMSFNKFRMKINKYLNQNFVDKINRFSSFVLINNDENTQVLIDLDNDNKDN